MYLRALHTSPITVENTDILAIIDQYVETFHEWDILAVTSKIVAICEGSVSPLDTEKSSLIDLEADAVLDVPNPYGVILTLKWGHLVASAGIDESNGDGHFILWPRDSQASANRIREYLCQKFHLTNIGVIITDSITRPLRWWVTGICLAHSGFLALRDYRDTADIFGRKLHFTQSNIADGLAAAAVLVMGEGDECTPLAVLSETSFVTFQDRNPTREELDSLRISRTEDVYGSFLESEHWRVK